MRLPVLSAIIVIVGVTIVVGAGMWLGESAGGEIASILIVIVSIGAVMAAFGRKIAANHELHVAREELAVLAVSEGRLRNTEPRRGDRRRLREGLALILRSLHRT